MSEHTPTPWTTLDKKGRHPIILEANGNQCAETCGETKAEAEEVRAYIVRAVNAHDELVEALDNSIQAMLKLVDGGSMASYSKAIELSIAALAKATGKAP